jgi:cysteine-rich repeat protein
VDNTDGCLQNCTLPSCGDGFVHAGVELCDDGNLFEDDACLSTCVPASCGDGFVQAGVEACDDGNTIGTDACTPSCAPAACGDGFVYAGVEECDDGDAGDNDGCSARCRVEHDYTCVGSPSQCSSAVEINCNDGVDNDGDGLSDCADSDCALGCDVNFGACGASESLIVYTATDVPKQILDLYTSSSVLPVYALGLVQRLALQFNATHTWDSDIDMTLISPNGTTGDMTSDNGGSGDNYTNTILNSACATAVTSGTAPFASCYKPETSMTVYSGGPSQGSWTLNVYDDTSGDLGSLTMWRLAMCVAPTLCGDGVVDGAEACDDGNNTNNDGCSSTCTLEAGFSCAGTAPTVCSAICNDGLVVGTECEDGNAVDGDGCTAGCVVEAGYACFGNPSYCATKCGDGFVVVGVEECDDGNTAVGDGCNSVCQIETAVTEIEANDTFAQADASALQITDLHTTISGAIAVVGDKDYFRFTLAADSVVRFETFDGTGANCTTIATAIRLYNAAQVQLYVDTTSGIGSCSALVTNLAAGTYYVQVERSGNSGTIAAYRLETTVLTSAGSELEANDTIATANRLSLRDTHTFGDHQVVADIDTYQIVVPMVRSLRLETIEGSAAETCESNGISSRIQLFNSAGTSLGTNDTSGRGNCSMLDGTGAPLVSPQSTAARYLNPGIYYVQVLAGSAGIGAAGQFDYRLIATLR